MCDLRDVNKVSVHPTQERVVGFVLNDRQSHTHRFLCFKLCRDANIKVVYNSFLVCCFKVKQF